MRADHVGVESPRISAGQLPSSRMMEGVRLTEDGLDNIQWLVKGSQGRLRTRTYNTESLIEPTELLLRLKGVVARKELGSFVSSWGVGYETVGGSVDETGFVAQFFSPGDVMVVPWTRATVSGTVTRRQEGGSHVGVRVHPGVGGFWVWTTATSIGLAALLFGVFQFATRHWWESFGIAAAISLVLIVVPPLLLWWGVYEGRNNERRLLDLIDEAISTPRPDVRRSAP